METVASVKSLLQSFNSIFWSRLGFMPVSFFEELDSPGTPEMFGPIVNSEDVHVEGQKQIGLHADHWNTWNFSDPLSSAYKAVATVIHSFYHDPQNMTAEAPFQPMDPDISGWFLSLLKEERRYSSCLGLLRSLQVNNIEFLSKAMKGTCSWIFENHTFGSWLEQPSGLLWVKGKAGSGKSTLLRYIHQTVTFRRPTSLLFFQFNYSSHTSINAMLRSLIFQLLAASPSYQLFRMRDTYAIRTETHGDYGTNWQWGDGELISYLQDSFLRATQDNTHIVVIIDALDEATEELSVNSVILDILSIPSIRICASSRSSPRFPGLDFHTITLEDLNTADIIYYAKSRVSSAECDISTVEGDLIQSLIEASDGMFLYADLVLSNLEIWFNQQEGQLSHIDFPRGLVDLYSLILADIESSQKSRDIFHHIFRWVAFATRPLTVSELTNALAFENVQGYETYNDRDSLYGITPLGWAAAYGHAEVVDLLLNHGATVDYTSNGTSPLDLAIRRGNKRVVELLLSKGSSMKQPTVTTQQALSLAASLGRASIVDILISYGANALAADEFGWSSLQIAIAAGKRVTLARLLSTIPKTSFERLRDLPPRNLPGWVQRILLAFGLGLCCRGSGSCSASATNAGPINPGKGSKRGGQGSRKRGRDTTENMDESDQQSMAPPPQKQSRHTFELRFACPYNKRYAPSEPLRVALNYEDGFDTNQSDTLKSLKPKQFETPVHHWEKTFNTVFPDWTTDLPSPYHETTETECRIRVAARLRSEEFRQEVWRNPSNMGREVFEQLANLLDPWPRASARPGNQSPSLPDELPIRPASVQEQVSTELNPSLEIGLSMEPRGGAASSEALAAAPVLDSSAQIYRPIPPHFLFPQQVSDTMSLSLFSGTGSLSSFGPGQESMYGDSDANDASMSSWDCSFANAQMGQIPNDSLEFDFNASTPANIPHSSRSENQFNRNRDLSTSGDTQPGEYEDTTNTSWAPSRTAD
ncbi:hypothetical protein J7337_013106 [Fusarium musae]|uniref:Nephrocystin 3-like N-terminal domain-containing protein n=1 Tax=Fusarium musae TaxID=1042133 RepID=A0A9P8D406_9HYPO|nr:hypothetical protein J7337_013106 [Fusarium musae]KAG9494877.1 hypothetical protein J7337_013106 [Fusarium musae]